MSIVTPATVRLFVFFKPALHDILELGLDVAEDGQAGQVTESAPLISKLLWLNHVNLSENQHKRTSIINIGVNHAVGCRSAVCKGRDDE